MALHVITEASGAEGSWRAEVDPRDGRTRLFDGPRQLASAWFCPPDRWERIEPNRPAIRSALARVGATLERLGFTPVRADEVCEEDSPDRGCEAI